MKLRLILLIAFLLKLASAQTVTHQAATAPVVTGLFTLGTGSITVGGNAGSATVELATVGPHAWTAAANDPWL